MIRHLDLAELHVFSRSLQKNDMYQLTEHRYYFSADC
jgi:hypothetical protein